MAAGSKIAVYCSVCMYHSEPLLERGIQFESEHDQRASTFFRTDLLYHSAEALSALQCQGIISVH